jgi:hypothetical protein
MARAQERRKTVADTGIITLGRPNQVLRITLNVGQGQDDMITVRFRQLGYQMAATSGDDVITINTMRFQDTTDPITLAPGEAASIDIDRDDTFIWGVRGIVLSSSQNVHVNASIVNKETGNIIAVLMGLVPVVQK